MRALSVHLIEGVIDEVAGTVRVTWVQPRVLSLRQVEALSSRIDGWLGRVHSALLTVEAESPELLGAGVVTAAA